MATEWRHKRHFRVRNVDDTLKTFTSAAEAVTTISFGSIYDTSSPTKTEELADSNQTLVVTYEFNTEAEQTAFKSAIDGQWSSGEESWPWNGNDSTQKIEHFKTEWLHKDGSVSATTTDLPIAP